MMKRFVYMKVTPDKYELPIAIADTAQELARITGSSVNTIYSAISNYRAGRTKRSVYVQVEIICRKGE